MSTCTLSWFSDRGFELELEVATSDVTIRMAAVPVPADGTTELSASPVTLDRLAILFKAHATVDGAMGQLQEAAVQLVGQNLELTAVVEDVETGQLVDVTAPIPVVLPDGVPEAGGPRPPPTDEDSLDWEDEHTLESIVMAAPAPPEPPAEQVADDGASVSQKGFERLLEAILANPEDEEEGDSEVAALPNSPTPVPAPAPAPPVADESDEADDQLMDPDEEAAGLLGVMIAREALELEEDFGLESLIAGTRTILELPTGPERKAVALSEWLLDQPAVADLYIGDDDLAELLAEW